MTDFYPIDYSSSLEWLVLFACCCGLLVVQQKPSRTEQNKTKDVGDGIALVVGPTVYSAVVSRHLPISFRTWCVLRRLMAGVDGLRLDVCRQEGLDPKSDVFRIVTLSRERGRDQ
jgi:hypothetical protein